MKCLSFALVLLTVTGSFADEPNPPKRGAAAREAQQAALTKVQSLVGVWRGTGQPQRGSNKGSWIEQADWAWKFTDNSAALTAKVNDGKYFSAVELQVGEKPGEYTLVAKSADGRGETLYRGKLDDEGKLVLTADKAVEAMPARISLRFVAGGDRLLALYERKSSLGEQLVRLAEVGYTRQGSGFGKGSTGPECVVTGGLGTIEVTHDGKTYYVCCTGCRDYFNSNPAEVLADYKARKAEEKAKAK